MKFYVYIFQTKLEMLYGQIQVPGARKREASIGFDIKVLKGELKESRDVSGSPYAKLSEVVAQLDESGLIGTLQSDSHSYVRGSCPMIWGTYGWPGHEDSGITFWAHEDGELVFALAGSKFHVLGEQRQGSADSASMTPAIADWLSSHVQEPSSSGTAAYAKLYSSRYGDKQLTEFDVANGIWLAVTHATGESSQFEFVAKALHRSKWPEGFRDSRSKRIVLGSPLYVSLER